MRLSDFVLGHLNEILTQWVASIRENAPVAAGLENAALRDHAHLVLVAVARALAQETSDPQAMVAVAEAAREHASSRVNLGLSLDQMISEYRGLRSDVIRRWTVQMEHFSRESHDDQIRFNDLLDHAVAASTAHYAMRLELARDLFLGMLGHDLRTPLAAISHTATLLRRADAPKEQHAEAIDRIAKCARRMDLMIQDLLDFTRSRLGTQLPMKPVPCDLAEFARQALDELSAFHPGTSIVFGASGNLQGTWDCERVMQLLSNLVDNAIRHHSGSDPVTVEVRGLEDHVEISVHNVGPVIPPSEQKLIFDPLRRGMHREQLPPASGGTAGLGLGLYIAQQIAVAHGGGIRLTSTAQEGTRFVATLARDRDGRPGHP